MRTLVVDHPLVAHKLTVLRDKNTPSPVFRQLTEELVTLLAYEATRDVRTEPVTIETPVSTTIGTAFTKPTPLVVPIRRAGLGMLEGMTKLVPTAEVGFLGMARDEETLDIITYAERLPEDLTDRQIFVLDPMLATGGTLREASSSSSSAAPPTSPASACLLPRRAWPSWRKSCQRPTSRSCWPRSTRSSTRSLTSCPAWATPETACTASPARSGAAEAQHGGTLPRRRGPR